MGRTRSFSDRLSAAGSEAGEQGISAMSPNKLQDLLQHAHRIATDPASSENASEKSSLLALRDKLYTGPAQGVSVQKRKRPYSSAGSDSSTKKCCSPTSFKDTQAMGDELFEKSLETVTDTYYNPTSTVENRQRYLWVRDDPSFKKKKTSKSQTQSAKVSLQDLQTHPTVGTLLLPFRRTQTIEKWSPREIALFESAICVVGKQFHQIQELVKTKTTKEIVEFYYTWKKTHHYETWKRTFDQNC